jgi:hypothetical protein
VRAELILHPEPGEAVEGSLTAEVQDVRVVRDGMHVADACYIERAGPLTALARLGREPTGIPLIVYVRPPGRETNPKGV